MTPRPAALIAACWLPFAFAHLRVNFGTFICAGLISGWFLGVMYVHLRRRSFSHAFWLTAASHSILNLLAIAVILAQRHA